jgi:protein-tyrosine phosphatase
VIDGAPAPRLRAGLLDLHAHILPGIDDGPVDEQETIEMARAALAAGITTLAATSHIDHNYLVDPAGIPGRVAAVRALLADHGIGLDLVGGGEVALVRLLELDDEDLRHVRLGSGTHLLIEPPFASPVPSLERLVADLRERGHEVLIAHPERCVSTADPERAQALVEQGVALQVTAASLLGKFGGTVRATAIEFLARGIVDVVASDAHGAASRSMDLAAAIASVEPDLPGISEQCPHLTQAAPAAILAGEPLPPRPPAPERRRGGLLRRLRRG